MLFYMDITCAFLDHHFGFRSGFELSPLPNSCTHNTSPMQSCCKQDCCCQVVQTRVTQTHVTTATATSHVLSCLCTPELGSLSCGAIVTHQTSWLKSTGLRAQQDNIESNKLAQVANPLPQYSDNKERTPKPVKFHQNDYVIPGSPKRDILQRNMQSVLQTVLTTDTKTLSYNTSICLAHVLSTSCHNTSFSLLRVC